MLSEAQKCADSAEMLRKFAHGSSLVFSLFSLMISVCAFQVILESGWLGSFPAGASVVCIIYAITLYRIGFEHFGLMMEHRQNILDDMWRQL